MRGLGVACGRGKRDVRVGGAWGFLGEEVRTEVLRRG